MLGRYLPKKFVVVNSQATPPYRKNTTVNLGALANVPSPSLPTFLIFSRLFSPPVCITWFPGDLKTRRRTGTSCQIEIQFSIKTTEFLFKYTRLLCSQIYDRFIILFTKHNDKVSASFIKEKQRYKWLKTAKWISILLLVLGLLLTVR